MQGFSQLCQVSPAFQQAQGDTNPKTWNIVIQLPPWQNTFEKVSHHSTALLISFALLQALIPLLFFLALRFINLKKRDFSVSTTAMLSRCLTSLFIQL